MQGACFVLDGLT